MKGDIDMTTITFDTLQFVKTLKSGDFTEKQAEALSFAFKKAQESNLDELATKGDIKEIELKIAESKVEIIKWVVGLMLAQTGLIIAVIKLVP
jgi:hypothetical protein